MRPVALDTCGRRQRPARLEGAHHLATGPFHITRVCAGVLTVDDVFDSAVEDEQKRVAHESAVLLGSRALEPQARYPSHRDLLRTGLHGAAFLREDVPHD